MVAPRVTVQKLMRSRVAMIGQFQATASRILQAAPVALVVGEKAGKLVGTPACLFQYLCVVRAGLKDIFIFHLPFGNIPTSNKTGGFLRLLRILSSFEVISKVLSL